MHKKAVLKGNVEFVDSNYHLDSQGSESIVSVSLFQLKPLGFSFCPKRQKETKTLFGKNKAVLWNVTTQGTFAFLAQDRRPCFCCSAAFLPVKLQKVVPISKILRDIRPYAIECRNQVSNRTEQP